MKGNNPISDILLERYILGETTSEESDIVKQKVSTDPLVKQRYQSILNANQCFDEKFNRQQTIKNIRFKADLNKGKTSKYFSPPGLAIALSLIICLIIVSPGGFISNEFDTQIFHSTDDTIRLKGIQPSLSIYRKQADNIEQLTQNSLVNKSDKLQIRYQRANYQYGVILSIDGRGDVTLHFPSTPLDSTKLDSKNSVDLPYSYELDNAPHFERFFMVTANHPLNPKEIIEQGKLLAQNIEQAKEKSLTINDNVHQTSLLLNKEKQ